MPDDSKSIELWPCGYQAALQSLKLQSQDNHHRSLSRCRRQAAQAM
jgi:hypothetical protein